MTRLPILTAKRLEKVLLSLGFQRVRQKGSHVKAEGRILIINY